VAVGTVKKSIETSSPMWLSRNVLQVCDGGFLLLGIQRETVRSEISMPSFNSSCHWTVENQSFQCRRDFGEPQAACRSAIDEPGRRLPRFGVRRFIAAFPERPAAAPGGLPPLSIGPPGSKAGNRLAEFPAASCLSRQVCNRPSGDESPHSKRLAVLQFRNPRLRCRPSYRDEDRAHVVPGCSSE